MRLSRALLAVVISLTALAAMTSSADAAPLRVVVYPGPGQAVRLGDEGGLGQTSKAFRAFVHHRLLKLWHQAGGTQRCRPAPQVTLESWTSTGFARAGEGSYAPCPGGGDNHLYVVRGGRWRAPRALASQEMRSCSLMRWFHVPLPVADRRCYTDLGKVVAYRHYRLPADFSTGDYAARTLARNVQDGTGFADAWAEPAVLVQLDRIRRHGGTAFTVTGCFDPDDPTYGALLAGAPRGCTLDITKGTKTRHLVMRIYPARFGRWQTRSLVAAFSSAGGRH